MNMPLHTESDVFSYSFVRLISCGCFEWKLNQMEGLFDVTVILGCNIQIVASNCILIFLR